ncbi:MAG: DUF4197 family protein [Saprospiraceae bacterium]
MKKFVSLLFALSFLVMSPSCNVNQGLAGLSPAQALNGVQALLGGASDSALKGFAGNILKNAVMQKALPKGLSAITNLLGNSSEGNKALDLLNGALGSAVPNVASSILGNATKGIAAGDALSILKGGDTGATDFLKKAAGQKLITALLPAITQKLTANGGLNAITSALGDKASTLLGNGKPSLADLVTNGVADGLFAMIGNAEKAERANPTTPALKDIFGK